jgi:hypothetical protein
MFDQGGGLFFFFFPYVKVCVGVSGPNIFDILVTCRIGIAASKSNCRTVKIALIQVLVEPFVCLLKCWCPEKLCPEGKHGFPLAPDHNDSV